MAFAMIDEAPAVRETNIRHPFMKQVFCGNGLMDRTIDDNGHRSPFPIEMTESSSATLESLLLMLHSLSNKLVPIVICSELALKRCGEDKVRIQLEKIQRSASEARDLLAEIRQLSQGEGIGRGENTSA